MVQLTLALLRPTDVELATLIFLLDVEVMLLPEVMVVQLTLALLRLTGVKLATLVFL